MIEGVGLLYLIGDCLRGRHRCKNGGVFALSVHLRVLDGLVGPGVQFFL